MAKAAPAYSMYPDSFEQGTDDMTLAEVGGYIRLLNSQWAKGSIPGDSIAKLSIIMRCTKATAASVWRVVGCKFERAADGTWRNPRLERERQKQATRREALAANGRLGGRPNHNQTKTNRFDSGLANQNQNESLPSPSPYKEDLSVPVDSGVLKSPSVALTPSRAPLITSPLAFDRVHGKHVTGFCDWCCFPEFLCVTFGNSADWTREQVIAWAHSIRSGWEGPRGDELKFWRARWDETHPQRGSTVGTRNKAVLQRFIERHQKPS